MPPSQKTCLITGCSEGGIGATLATAFKDKGYHVFVTARSPSKIPETLRSDPSVTTLALDVSLTSSIKAAADAVSQRTKGRLDVLINNAGHGINKPLLDTSPEQMKQLFDVNFFGVMETTQVFAPMLVRAQGCIVNNSSLGGFQAFPFNGAYGASKAALTLASETLRLEMAPLGVRVITLLTGGVATKFITNLDTVDLPSDSYYTNVKDIIQHKSEDIPFAQSPEEFAQSVLRPVERGASGKMWVGGAAWMARAMMSFLPLPDAFYDWVALRQKPFSRRLAEERKKMQ